MVLKVNLDNLVRESEHDCMSCSHPLFNVDNFFDLSLFLCTTLGVLFHHTLWLVITLQVAPEVLEKSNFLLKLLRVLSKSVFFANILAITGSPFHVIDVVAIWVQYYFS